MNPKSGKVTIAKTRTAVNTNLDLDAFDVIEWLTLTDNYRWLLAHTYDGVVWGRYDEDGKWRFSSDYISNSPSLQTDELLELRIFGADGETYLWQTEDGFIGRTITDNQDGAEESHYYDEPQILWGTQITALEDGFTQLQDGTQGLTHAIPCSSGLPVDETRNLDAVRPASLTVRHYIEQDEDTGLARVIQSRLVNVSLNTKAIKEDKNGS